MKLIVVESPTKAKTIKNFLGKDFDVESTFGHVRDLPKSKIGINIEENFKPHYITVSKARDKVKKIAEKAKKADIIYYATDEDREGEAIAWHLDTLFNKTYKIPAEKRRIAFHEITKSAIEDALNNPRSINQNLVDAQQARRILDRLVGYKLSPFLWKKVMRGLSAGRVQSVTVRLIVEREKEIKAFKPEEYWSIEGKFLLKNTQENLMSHLVATNGKKLSKFDLKNEKITNELCKNLEQLTYSVEKIDQKSTKKKPYAPYRTSTLQQDAYIKFGFSSKQTMLLAQQLYEGIKLNNETTGLITYMRTDSVFLSNKFIVQVKKYIRDTFGLHYIPKKDRIYKNKSKVAQEAHEAIRPTNVSLTPEMVCQHLNKSQYKLYTLIWQRAVASLMADAEIAQKSIDICGKSDQKELSSALFRSSGSTITFDGFLKVYPVKISENELPEITQGTHAVLEKVTSIQHFTTPPPRYNDASLVKKLEALEIGRPSTYAPTLDTIQKRNYVEKDESKRFFPTEIGELVNDLLEKHFPEIIDYDFTADLENKLDSIANKKTKWQNIIKNFYAPFEKNLETKYKEVHKKEIAEEKTNSLCPKCEKHDLIIKIGRFGKFLACPGFPDCKHTEALPIDKLSNKKNGQTTTEEAPFCEKCNTDMILKEGRYGKFWACPNYPLCKKTKPILKSLHISCPVCYEGEVVIKKTKKGKIFYGCSRYPDCEFSSWKKPDASPAEISKTQELK